MEKDRDVLPCNDMFGSLLLRDVEIIFYKLALLVSESKFMNGYITYIMDLG